MNSENQSTPTVSTRSSFVLSVPLAIIIAGALVAAALYFKPGGVGVPSSGTSANQGGSAPEAQAPETVVGNFRAVDEKTDHIRGSQNAKVTVIEYADTECPFCKRFHPTMQQLIREYPNDVRWVYRHFPLDALHPKARKESEATECAGELGGSDKFWAYLDRLYEVTPSNDGLDPAELPKIAEFVGLNGAQFEQCLSSGKYAQHVADDLADAESAGGTGTPYSVVLAAGGEKFPLEGAQPYAAVKQLVEQALASK